MLRKKLQQAKRDYESQKFDGDLGELVPKATLARFWPLGMAASAAAVAAAIVILVLVIRSEDRSRPLNVPGPEDVVKDDSQNRNGQKKTPQYLTLKEKDDSRKQKNYFRLPNFSLKNSLSPAFKRKRRITSTVISQQRKRRFGLPALSLATDHLASSSSFRTGPLRSLSTPSLRRAVRPQLKFQLKSLQSLRRRDHET